MVASKPVLVLSDDLSDVCATRRGEAATISHPAKNTKHGLPSAASQLQSQHKTAHTVGLRMLVPKRARRCRNDWKSFVLSGFPSLHLNLSNLLSILMLGAALAVAQGR